MGGAVVSAAKKVLTFVIIYAIAKGTKNLVPCQSGYNYFN